ncbi:fibronectin type III domain-containing protein, partial [bacterium]|nr:fibronectin type III domain-containing protein [bacterium]
MRTTVRFLLSCLILTGCLYWLTCANPESLQIGWLKITLDWDPRPIYLNTSAPAVIDSVRYSLRPGGKRFTFRPDDSGNHMAVEMDYYDVHVEALADSGKVYYVADTSRIFVQENETNRFYLTVRNVRLTQAPEFTGLPSPFAINSDTVTLRWTSPAFAEEYVLERSGTPDFSQKDTLYTGEDAQFQVSGLTTAVHYFRVAARNDLGSSPYSQVAAVQVSLAENLIIVTTQLNDCILSQPYSQAVQATGGVPPYVWTVQGTLPDGLGFSQAGVLSGTAAQS